MFTASVALLAGCDHITAVTRTTTLASMPTMTCLAEAMKAYESGEKDIISDFSDPKARPPQDTPTTQHAQHMIAFEVYPTARQLFQRVSVEVRDLSPGAELFQEFSDFGPTHTDTEISETLRAMKRIESHILRACSTSATTQPVEQCGAGDSCAR